MYIHIPNFTSYLINESGDIVTLHYEKVKLFKVKDRYVFCNLIDDNGFRRPVSVHRALLMAFSPLPSYEGMVVNHIDGNKHNNVYHNLEWCTYQENQHHAGELGLTERCIPTTLMLPTKECIEFPSMVACAQYLGITKDAIAWRLSKPNNLVWDGFRFKNKIGGWLTNEIVMCEKIHLKDLLTNEIMIFDKQKDVCQYLNVSPAFVSQELSKGKQRVLPKFKQMKWESEEWRTINDIFSEYNNCTGNRCCKLIYPNGDFKIYETIADLALSIGKGKTTVKYRLDFKHGQLCKDGFRYEYC